MWTIARFYHVINGVKDLGVICNCTPFAPAPRTELYGGDRVVSEIHAQRNGKDIQRVALSSKLISVTISSFGLGQAMPEKSLIYSL